MSGVDRLARMIASMDRRLKNLERAPQLGNSSFDGTLREYDDEDQARVLLGLLPDGSHGLATFNDGEWLQFPRDRGVPGASEILLWQNDQFPLGTSGAINLDLTYVPIEKSPCVTVNGIVAREGLDYIMDGAVLRILTAAATVVGDYLDVRYAHRGVVWEPPPPPPSLTLLEDTFNRPDGVDGVRYRSDGGLWTLSSDTGDVDRWAISSQRLVKTTSGFYTMGGGGTWLHWVTAQLEDVDELTITTDLYSPDPYGSIWVYFGGNPGQMDDGSGIQFTAQQYERYTRIKAGGSNIWTSIYSIANWENSNPHPLVIKYSRLTMQLKVTFNGVVIYDQNIGFVTPGSQFALGSDRPNNGFQHITVTSGI